MNASRTWVSVCVVVGLLAGTASRASAGMIYNLVSPTNGYAVTGTVRTNGHLEPIPVGREKPISPVARGVCRWRFTDEQE